MEINEYQRLANQTDQQPENESLEADPRSIMIPLLGMAGEVGELLGEHKKWLRDGESYKLFPERVKEELGDLLWYLSNVATKHGLTLEEVADFNLSKTGRRWQPVSTNREKRKLFDDEFPPSERLPRQMDIAIKEDSGIAITTIDGAKYGDPLTDNRYEDDGYRFHDICHLSYASVSRVVSHHEGLDAAQAEERPQGRRSRGRRPGPSSLRRVSPAMVFQLCRSAETSLRGLRE